MPSAYEMLFPTIVIICIQFTQILAEICDNGSRCRLPQKCCDSGCCFSDSHFDNDEPEDRYTYGYRLSVWNMWYFWFVVLFVLMSCFGGCGYYRQRQRVIRTQQGLGGGGNTGNSFLSSFQMPSSRRHRGGHGGAGTVTLEPTYGTPYTYSRQGEIIPPSNTILTPPPYSEVVSNPDLFPSSKITMTPGQPVVTPSAMGSAVPIYGNQVDMDPPHLPTYSEVINMSPNQDVPSSAAANQNQPPQITLNSANHSQDNSSSSANQRGSAL